ncbi:MAG: hypothetical protein ABI282_07815 [Candidatus Baltobacteraceae bacterium]
MNRTKGVRKLLDSGAIDVLDFTAVPANRVVMVMRGRAKHIRRFARLVHSLRRFALGEQMLERPIDGGERYFCALLLKSAVNIGGGQKPALGP